MLEVRASLTHYYAVVMLKPSPLIIKQKEKLFNIIQIDTTDTLQCSAYGCPGWSAVTT